METAQGMVTSVSCNGVYSFTKPMRDEIVLVAGIGVEGDSHAGVHVRHQGRVRADPTQPNLRQVHLIHEELFAEVARKGFEVRPGHLGENVTTRGLDLLGLPVGTVLRFGAPPTEGNGAVARETAANGEPAGSGSGGGGPAGTGSGGGGPAGTGSGGGGPAGTGSGGRRPAGTVVAGAPVGVGGGTEVLAGVLAAAEATTLNEPTARAAAAVRAALAREAAAEEAQGADGRPALVVAGLRNPCGQINGLQPGLLKEMIGRDDEGNLVRKGGVMTVVLRGGLVRPGDPITAELPPLPRAPLDPV